VEKKLKALEPAGEVKFHFIVERQTQRQLREQLPPTKYEGIVLFGGAKVKAGRRRLEKNSIELAAWLRVGCETV
jgi:hypothetical protein